jgi:hypothetical protein
LPSPAGESPAAADNHSLDYPKCSPHLRKEYRGTGRLSDHQFACQRGVFRLGLFLPAQGSSRDYSNGHLGHSNLLTGFPYLALSPDPAPPPQLLKPPAINLQIAAATRHCGSMCSAMSPENRTLGQGRGGKARGRVSGARRGGDRALSRHPATRARDHVRSSLCKRTGAASAYRAGSQQAARRAVPKPISTSRLWAHERPNTRSAPCPNAPSPSRATLYLR